MNVHGKQRLGTVLCKGEEFDPHKCACGPPSLASQTLAVGSTTQVQGKVSHTTTTEPVHGMLVKPTHYL